MTLAKAVISGTVYREPQKRSTTNNLPVTYVTLNVSDNDTTLIRVIAFGELADSLEKSVHKSDRIIAEGRLQNATVQDDNGQERKIVEINLSSFEVVSSSGNSSAPQKADKVVEFAEVEMNDNLIGEEEIPF